MRKKIKNKVYLDGKRVQLIDIYYSGIGMLRELIPEEMEEAFQKHLAKQKKRHSQRLHRITKSIIQFKYKSLFGHLPYGGYPNGDCFRFWQVAPI